VLERIMLRLHTVCVAPEVTPIKAKSNENEIKFLSAASKESEVSNVQLHEIIYTKPSGTKKGTLTEKIYERIKPPTGKEAPEYTFETTPKSTVKLLTGVKSSESGGKTLPIFSYYRYYKSSDALPNGDTTTPYYELYPNELSKTAMESEEEAKNVAKVTVSFTVVPEGTESATFNRDRPVPLEDSAVFRLATAAETSHNVPCSPVT
jgi:hypothetical protein